VPRDSVGKTLREGDIVNIDVTPLLDGWHGDSSRMYLVGDVSLKARRLVEVTLRVPDARHRPGPPRRAARRHRRGDPGARRAVPLRRGCATSAATASAACSTTPPKWSTPRARGHRPELRAGMFMTIEPMINLGKPR
jgi:methionyl aminopeptidase